MIKYYSLSICTHTNSLPLHILSFQLIFYYTDIGKGNESGRRGVQTVGRDDWLQRVRSSRRLGSQADSQWELHQEGSF